MKKIISLFLCLSFVFSLFSCDKIIKNADDTESNKNSNTNLDNYYKELELYTKYLEDKALYDQKKDEYGIYLEAYSEYAKDLELYDQYLECKILYDQNKAEYDGYLVAREKYEQDLIEYNNYLKELDNYKKIKDSNDKKEAEYNTALEQYNKYLNGTVSFESQIETFDNALFTKVTYLERELYASLFSPLIDEVVANKDKLITAFGNNLADPINNSKAATENIRKIFRPEGGTAYDKLTTLDEKYTFYVNNYDALCANILLLGESLYKIYTTSDIRALMHQASALLGRLDYTEKLSIFIGQLLCLSDALHDKEMSYTDGNGKSHKLSEIKFSYWNQAGTEIKNISINDMFENKVYVTDTNNATPGSLVEVKKPTEPDYEELPLIPAVVEKPVEPTVVAYPGNAPEEVKKPIEPIKVENPGEPPEAVKKPAPPEGVSEN